MMTGRTIMECIFTPFGVNARKILNANDAIK
jgi:hypothetical protein